MIAEPSSQRRLIEITTCQSEHGGDDFFLGNVDAEAVQAQEEIHGLKGHALVSIAEGMVARDAEAVGRGQSRKVGVRVVVKSVAGPLERRFEEPTVAQSDSASVGLDLIRVDGEDVGGSQPTRLIHLESSRMALRYRLAPSA